MEEQIYNVSIERYGVRFVNRLLSLDVSKDHHYILMICNLFSEYNDYDKVRNTISRYYQIEQYLDSSEAQKYDKYSGDIDIDIAVGTFRMGNNPNVLKKCQIFYDEGVCLYKPHSFEEASVIGGRLWNFCSDESLFQKMNANGGRVYFTYNALANYTIDYVAAIAKSDGYVDAYNKNGSRLNRQEYAQWKEGLGSAFALLKPSNSNENKQYKANTNMNKKLIRLTESDLHKIVKESVKRIIKEGWEDVPSDIFNALNMNNANTVGTRHFGDYDAVSEKPYYQDDLRGEEPSVISIEVLKPFFINRGQGSGNFYTSAGGEQLVVLPNQTIELKEREINWISKRSEYVGEAKCSHHITKGVYISDDKFSGTGVAKIVIEGYSTLLKGQEKGFIKINWAK